jgi:hypothetical protein
MIDFVRGWRGLPVLSGRGLCSELLEVNMLQLPLLHSQIWIEIKINYLFFILFLMAKAPLALCSFFSSHQHEDNTALASTTGTRQGWPPTQTNTPSNTG